MPARIDRATRVALWAFVLTRLPVIVIAELAPSLVGERAHRIEATTNPWLHMWAHWDGVHYLAVARHGYTNTDFAFFPLYPLLIRTLAPLFGGDVIAGIVISNAAFLGALILFVRIVAEEFDDETAERAVLYLAAYPAAVFFSAVYTESLFLALTLGSFYALRRGHFVIAGLVGGFAAATRVEGVLLIIPYVVRIMTSGEHGLAALATQKQVRQQLALGAVFIGTGLIAFMVEVGLLTGNPLAFESVQKHWDRHLAPPWVGITGAVRAIAHAHDAVGVGIHVIELAFTLGTIALLIAAYRTVRKDEWWYALASLLLPISTSSLMSTPRFAAVLFPLFTALAVWSAPPRIHLAIVLLFGCGLGMFTLLFAAGLWIA